VTRRAVRGRESKPVCCAGCGRDTQRASGLCTQCDPDYRPPPVVNPPPRPWIAPLLEDDYSEDSNADSVCAP